MKHQIKKYISMLLLLIMTLSLCGCASTAGQVQEYIGGIELTQTPEESATVTPETTENMPDVTSEAENPAQEEVLPEIEEDGWYYTAEDVGLYLLVYGRLPENFITKGEARELGWTGGTVENYMAGYAIGGDKFQNREGLLPKKEGRQYYECDIDTQGKGSRGVKRIVFSNDGLVYYTTDHYESFTLLYGEE